MVAVAVQPWRRDQGGEMVDERQRGEGQRGASVTLWLRQTIDDPLIVDLCDALKGEGRACTVAKQPLQSGPVVAGDAHRGVERETAIVPSQHVAGVVGIEQAVAGEPVQHAAADLLFDHGSRLWRQCRGLSELDPASFERLEHPVEDAAVVVQVAIERSTATVVEAQGPEAGPCRGLGTAAAQMSLDHPQEDMQHGSDRLWLPFQVPAQALLLDEAVEDGLLGATTGVGRGSASLWVGGHTGGATRSCG